MPVAHELTDSTIEQKASPETKWVLSLPIPLRVLLATPPDVVTPVLQWAARGQAAPAEAGQARE